MGKDTKKAQEKQIQYLLKAYKEFEERWKKRGKEQNRRIDFTEGVALGLIYGIIGNLMVQHWYPLFERLILANFDIVFWSNLAVWGFALVIILYVTRRFRSQLKEARRKRRIARESEGRARLKQEELKQYLEELKKVKRTYAHATHF